MTAAYVVRTIETHELVGFFVVETFHDLADVVDEKYDPGVCEAMRLSHHGGIFIDVEAPSVPLPRSREDDDEEDDDPFDPIFDDAAEKLYRHGWELSEQWFDPFMSKGRWRAVGAPVWIHNNQELAAAMDITIPEKVQS